MDRGDSANFAYRTVDFLRFFKFRKVKTQSIFADFGPFFQKIFRERRISKKFFKNFSIFFRVKTWRKKRTKPIFRKMTHFRGPKNFFEKSTFFSSEKGAKKFFSKKSRFFFFQKNLSKFDRSRHKRPKSFFGSKFFFHSEDFDFF